LAITVKAGSERNIVFRRGRFIVLGRRRRRCRAGWRTARRWRGWTGARGAPSAFFSASKIKKLKGLEDNTEFASLLLRLLIFPGIQTKAALDHDRPALFHIVRERLGLFAEGVDVNKGHFLLIFPGIGIFPGTIDSHAEPGDRHSLLGVAQFRIPGQVANEDDFVVGGHTLLYGRRGDGRLGLRSHCEQHPENLIRHIEFMLERAQVVGLDAEDEIGIVAGAVALIGDSGKWALVHFLHRLDSTAGGVDIGGEAVN